MAKAASLACLVLAAAGLGTRAWGLSAAAGKIDITPSSDERRGVYLAGFGAKGRRPSGVHDPLYAHLLVLKDGPRVVALASLDLLGFYRNDVEDLRRLSGFNGPDHHLFVAATHDHSGPDTLGFWGPWAGASGVNKRWQRRTKDRVAAALRDLEAHLREVRLNGWHGRLDPQGLCRDGRDPVIIDPDLAALEFSDRNGHSVATIVNWSCHAEALGRDNLLITADFPGFLCGKVERERGGTCLFFNGAIGGLLTPERAPGRDGFAEANRIGTAVAGAALHGLAGASLRQEHPALDFRSRLVRVPIENSRYLLALPALTFGHRLFDSAGRPLPGWQAYWLALRHALGMLRPEARPWIETEVSVLDVGPARLLGIPGEAFPELVIGGYDGRYRYGHSLVRPENADPPDLAAAPRPPYLKDFIRRPLPMVVGLANDEIGYLVPKYDFKIRDNRLMLPRLPGDHYEETNSIGPAATGLIVHAAEGLLGDHP